MRAVSQASRDKQERDVTSWFAIALAEIGTKGILREKADCKANVQTLNVGDIQPAACEELKFGYSLRKLLLVV